MICKHDMNVFINRQLIYNYPEQVNMNMNTEQLTHFKIVSIEKCEHYNFVYRKFHCKNKIFLGYTGIFANFIAISGDLGSSGQHFLRHVG